MSMHRYRVVDSIEHSHFHVAAGPARLEHRQDCNKVRYEAVGGNERVRGWISL